jgi:predicted nucleic acid-binding protein
MNEQFLDTNILIRHFAQDNPDQAARCRTFLAALESGDDEAELLEAILAEAVYVLGSKASYGYPRQAIRGYLTDVVLFPGVRIAHKSTYVRALDLYERHNVDFEDALIAAHMERTGAAAVISFDRDFDRIPGITRREP